MGPPTIRPAAYDPALGSDKHCGDGSVPFHRDWVRLRCGFLSLRLVKTSLSHAHWTLARSAAHTHPWLLEWPILGGRILRNFRSVADILRVIRHIGTNRWTCSRAPWELAHPGWLFVRRAVLSRDFKGRTMVHREV